MAQLNATTINGNLTVTGGVTSTNSVQANSYGKFTNLRLSTEKPNISFYYNNASSYTSRISSESDGDLYFRGGDYGLILSTRAGVMQPTAAGGISLGGTSLPFYILRTQNSPVVTSMAEAKENIRPFTSALDEIDKTDVFNYNLKACLEKEGKDIEHTGFVIGEGYNCSNLLISHDGNSIDLYNGIGVTLGGVKELYELVKTQQKQLDEQQSKIDALESRLNALEEQSNK